MTDGVEIVSPEPSAAPVSAPPAPAVAAPALVRYSDDVKRQAVALAQQGVTHEEIAARLGVQRAKSISAWVKRAQGSGLVAPVAHDPAAAARAQAAIAANAPGAAAPPAAAPAAGAPAAEPDPADEPLNLSVEEVQALCDYVVKVGDAIGKRLIWRRWDIELQGMDKGQATLVKVFAKRVSRCIDRVTDGQVANPLEFLCVFAGFLALPRAFACLMHRPPAPVQPAASASPPGAG